MSSLASRLRDIVGSGTTNRLRQDFSGAPELQAKVEACPHVEVAEPAQDPRGLRLERAHHVADLFGGAWSDDGQYLVVDRSYGPGYRHGRVPIMDSMPPWPRLSLLRGSAVRPSEDPRLHDEDARSGSRGWSDPRERLLFIDLETTGIAGGAGTYAFLVGCGWFDGPTFRIRQFFLSTYAGERALLEGVGHLTDGITGVVSFNGKSFDLPLIETRYLLHRLKTPFSGLPHVDMLHPARRLWRAEEDAAARTTASCRLSVLERTLCGVARENDVPGFEIPSRYFHYVRTGDARPLHGVFEHNRLDLISLALITARASRLLDGGPRATSTAREALGLGRLYEGGGLWDLAREAYAIAAGFGPPDGTPQANTVVRAGLNRPDSVTCAEGLRSYAVICRRQRLFVQAAQAWKRLLELHRCPPHIAREATEALAVHHEHRVRDLRSARQFALQSLGFNSSLSRQHATRHRLARLERKLGGPTTDTLRF